MTTLRVGVDVGGTFTDLVAQDGARGTVARVKVPSTPEAPERGVLDAIARLLEHARPEAIAFLGHSSTIATNALLGQIGLELPRIALLTTEGFRDVLEIGRQNRSDLYNLFVRRPRPLVPRRLRFGVRERLGAYGEPLVALEPAALEAIAVELAAANVEGVAVAYLHAYANPVHERRTRDLLRELLPHVPVTLSSDVDPEYREYERTSTTVVNALLAPLVRGYLERLKEGAAERGVRAPLFVMQSNGGVASLDAVAARPATTIESGPAAGVIGAALLGRRLGLERVLSFDMGGTTAKAGTIIGGEPQVAHEFEAAGRTHSGRAVKGSGYPVRFPFVDLAEVSAGGGTIAHVDAGGALRVGPLSAGADPGPAAYGRGSAATVTDADIVLGRLNPHALLGGALRIDAHRSRAALETLLNDLPDLNLAALAAGIVRLIDAEMAKVLRIVTIERGLDPRHFTLVAFGGGGPLHACALADELEIPRIVVPTDPGLFSAQGLLGANLRVSGVRSFIAPFESVAPLDVEHAFAGLEERGAHDLTLQGIAPAAMRFVRELELRYAGQSFELSVGATTPFDAAAHALAVSAFHDRHRRVYGFADTSEPLELVTARSTAIGLVATGEPSRPEPSTAAAADAALIERRAALSEAGDSEAIAVFARERLRPGMRVAGPAAIEQYDATTFVAPHWEARVDACEELVLERIG